MFWTDGRHLIRCWCCCLVSTRKPRSVLRSRKPVSRLVPDEIGAKKSLTDKVVKHTHCQKKERELGLGFRLQVDTCKIHPSQCFFFYSDDSNIIEKQSKQVPAERFLLLLQLFFLFFGSDQNNSSVFFFLYRHTDAQHDGREEGRKEVRAMEKLSLSPTVLSAF